MRLTRKAHWLAIATGIMLGVGALQAEASPPVSNPSIASSARPRAVETYVRRPLVFEANQGQTDPRVKFLARGDGYGLFLTPAEAVLSLGKPDAARSLRVHWVGANAAARISGQEEQAGKINYLRGDDPSKWQRNVATYAKARYEGIYPGIDLVFYGNQRQLEHDFVLAPGADPGRIRLAIEGSDRLKIDAAGDLVIYLGGEEVRLKKPVSYQEIGGARRQVDSGWQWTGKGGLGFRIGDYNPARPLVIDPILGFSTYLGGMYPDQAEDVAVDTAGYGYVTGSTASPDFPGAGPRPIASDAFVVKFSPAGEVVYTAFVGGSDSDDGLGIAVDPAGSVYLTGFTYSRDFPQLPRLQPPGSSSLPDGFIAKLDPGGSTLVYATTFGGTNRDWGRRIALDAQNNAYVVGLTNSPGFPTLQAWAPFRGGYDDFFVVKFSADGSRVIYFTYLGGSDYEESPDIAVDPEGHAYVTGFTFSPDFPTLHSITPFVANGGYHAFLTKLDLSGGSYVYSTILGGSDLEMGFSVAADEEGYAYVTGDTGSVDFPVTPGALQTTIRFFEIFVTKLNPAGSLVFSTLFGGRGIEAGYGIAVDNSRNIYLTGLTDSLDFPLRNEFQSQCLPVLSADQCGQNAFVAKLSADGAKVLYSSYLGGTSPQYSTSEEYGLGIATDSRGSAYVVGHTTATDFPTVNAIQPSHASDRIDGFVARIVENQPPDCSAAFASPATLWPPDGRLVPIAIRNVTDPDGDAAVITVTGVSQDEPLGKPGTPDAIGIGTSSASVRADRDGKGDGRVYRLSFTATDPQGASCTGAVTVCVPHDQGRGRTCGDGGGLFNSGG